MPGCRPRPKVLCCKLPRPMMARVTFFLASWASGTKPPRHHWAVGPRSPQICPGMGILETSTAPRVPQCEDGRDTPVRVLGDEWRCPEAWIPRSAHCCRKVTKPTGVSNLPCDSSIIIRRWRVENIAYCSGTWHQSSNRTIPVATPALAGPLLWCFGFWPWPCFYSGKRGQLNKIGSPHQPTVAVITIRHPGEQRDIGFNHKLRVRSTRM